MTARAWLLCRGAESQRNNPKFFKRKELYLAFTIQNTLIIYLQLQFKYNARAVSFQYSFRSEF